MAVDQTDLEICSTVFANSTKCDFDQAFIKLAGKFTAQTTVYSSSLGASSLTKTSGLYSLILILNLIMHIVSPQWW